MLNTVFSRVSATKARVLGALAGLVCAVLVSALIVPNPPNIEAGTAPILLWWEWPEPLCGEGCYAVGCRDACDIHLVLMGHDCCNPGAEEGFSCLYCGP